MEVTFTMVWASKLDVMEKVASVPDLWLRRFAERYPKDVRKFGDRKQCAKLYRVSKVLECIENGEYFLDDEDDGKEDA